jgi:hypothetical protein
LSARGPFSGITFIRYVDKITTKNVTKNVNKS